MTRVRGRVFPAEGTCGQKGVPKGMTFHDIRKSSVSLERKVCVAGWWMLQLDRLLRTNYTCLTGRAKELELLVAARPPGESRGVSKARVTWSCAVCGRNDPVAVQRVSRRRTGDWGWAVRSCKSPGEGGRGSELRRGGQNESKCGPEAISGVEWTGFSDWMGWRLGRG